MLFYKKRFMNTDSKLNTLVKKYTNSEKLFYLEYLINELERHNSET